MAAVHLSHRGEVSRDLPLFQSQAPPRSKPSPTMQSEMTRPKQDSSETACRDWSELRGASKKRSTREEAMFETVFIEPP